MPRAFPAPTKDRVVTDKHKGDPGSSPGMPNGNSLRPGGSPALDAGSKRNKEGSKN